MSRGHIPCPGGHLIHRDRHAAEPRLVLLRIWGVPWHEVAAPPLVQRETVAGEKEQQARTGRVAVPANEILDAPAQLVAGWVVERLDGVESKSAKRRLQVGQF